eukprot:EG_transcript_36247
MAFPSPDTLEAAAAFHRLAGIPIAPAPAIPAAPRCALRLALLQEELGELQEAIRRDDLVEVADALADLQYVLSGTVLEFGLGDRFRAVFDEVHRSNMSKACRTPEEAQATVEHYTALGQPCHFDRMPDGCYVVRRSADDKVLKSVRYSPPSLGPLLSSHGAPTER